MTTSEVVGQVLAVTIPLVIATSVWLAGDRRMLSWPLGVVAQLVTGAYGVVTHYWGWVLSALVVGPVFVRNWIKWRRDTEK